MDLKSPIFAEEGVRQTDELEFLVFNDFAPEVIAWLKDDCVYSYDILPIYAPTNPHANHSAKIRHAFVITFHERKASMEFKLRWFKNA